jgi:hypothetical protein
VAGWNLIGKHKKEIVARIIKQLDGRYENLTQENNLKCWLLK